MTRVLVALLVPLLLLPACQPRRDDHGAGPGTTATGDPGRLALAVTVVSAWPDQRVPGAPAPPVVRIAGDGGFRASVVDEETQERQLLTGRLDAARLDRLLDAAAALPTGDAYGPPGLDGSVTTVTLGSASGLPRTREIGVWVPEAQGYTGRDARHREAFVDLLDELDDAVREAGTPWEPERYLLLTAPMTVDDDRPRPSWPLPDVRPLPCQPLDADDAARLGGVLDVERHGPLGVDVDGAVHGVVLLPVLTDETCADLEPFRYPLE